MTELRNERDCALLLAARILDRRGIDPDDDQSVLARQLIRETERRAAERAATLEECLEAVCDSQRAGSRDTADSAIRKLPYDRSALDEMLAQARREQREKDASALEFLADEIESSPNAGAEQLNRALAYRGSAAAIRAQESGE